MLEIDSPSELPDMSKVEEVREPMINANLIVPAPWRRHSTGVGSQPMRAALVAGLQGNLDAAIAEKWGLSRAEAESLKRRFSEPQSDDLSIDRAAFEAVCPLSLSRKFPRFRSS